MKNRMNLKENSKILQLCLQSWQHMWFVLWLEDRWSDLAILLVTSAPEDLPAIGCFLLHGEPLGYLKQLEVVAIVCDWATSNRRFFRIHAIENGLNMSEGVVYWVTNCYDLSRKIFFSDPPHLIKTIRNNFENSGGHNYTRSVRSVRLQSLVYAPQVSTRDFFICSNYQL